MQISRVIKSAVFCLAAMLTAVQMAAAQEVRFRSVDDALKQGISAYNGNYLELALPALEAVLIDVKDQQDQRHVLARFYLAQIYGDSDAVYNDHARAYRMYKELVAELRDIDPVNDELAPVAARALTELSRYQRRGISSIGVRANRRAADNNLHRAAITFNNEDAQFELAKVLLQGDGEDLTLGGSDDAQRRIKNGVHHLSRLSRTGYAPAQAYLADLLWRGRFVPEDKIAALNLIDVAASNAPIQDRVWIEDIYQNIFCNAGKGVRQQATGRVAEWRSRFGRRYLPRGDIHGLANLSIGPVRTCSSGERVRPMDVREINGSQPVEVKGGLNDDVPQAPPVRASTTD